MWLRRVESLDRKQPQTLHMYRRLSLPTTQKREVSCGWRSCMWDTMRDLLERVSPHTLQRYCLISATEEEEEEDEDEDEDEEDEEDEDEDEEYDEEEDGDDDNDEGDDADEGSMASFAAVTDRGLQNAEAFLRVSAKIS